MEPTLGNTILTPFKAVLKEILECAAEAVEAEKHPGKKYGWTSEDHFTKLYE